MKVGKIILALVVVLAVIIVGIIFLKDGSYDVTRSVSVNAPRAMAHRYVSHFNHFKEYSPWQELDENMKVTFTGNMGEVGSVYSWIGNDDVGEGVMTLTEVSPFQVTIDMLFKAPFESQAEAYYVLAEEEGGSTNITWGLRGESTGVAKLFMLFMSMDDAIGADYEKGLAKLKTVLEAQASVPSYDGFEVQRMAEATHHFVGLRKQINMNEMVPFFTANLMETHAKAVSADVANGAPSSVTFDWNEAENTIDLAVAVPTPADAKVRGLESFSITGQSLVVDYYGDFETSGVAYRAFDEYLADFGGSYADYAWEEYLTDSEQEPDTAKWHTRIHYFIK